MWQETCHALASLQMSSMFPDYGTFFIFEQEGKEDVFTQNCTFVRLKRYNEAKYIGEWVGFDQYSRLGTASAVRGTSLSISTPVQTYVSVMAELFSMGASFLPPAFFVFSNYRRFAGLCLWR
jgi:hypothetical protein